VLFRAPDLLTAHRHHVELDGLYVHHEDQAHHHRGSRRSSPREAPRAGKGCVAVALIEGALREMVEPVGPSFTEKWRGSLRLAGRDDDRFKALEEKYG